MPTYAGSCHCGAVRFSLTKAAPLAEAIECNCSVCTKKGVLLVPAEETELQIEQGEDKLQLYQWRSNTAHHWFCGTCGIHAFNRPRNNPERLAVNIRCLDDYWAMLPGITIKPFDGQNHPKDQAADTG